VKYYFPRRDHVRFQPANKNMAPIYVRAADFKRRCLLASWSASFALRLAGLERVLDRGRSRRRYRLGQRCGFHRRCGRHAGYFLLGCGGVHYAIAGQRGGIARQEAKALGADQLAPTILFAKEHLHSAGRSPRRRVTRRGQLAKRPRSTRARPSSSRRRRVARGHEPRENALSAVGGRCSRCLESACAQGGRRCVARSAALDHPRGAEKTARMTCAPRSSPVGEVPARVCGRSTWKRAAVDADPSRQGRAMRSAFTAEPADRCTSSSVEEPSAVVVTTGRRLVDQDQCLSPSRGKARLHLESTVHVTDARSILDGERRIARDGCSA